MTAAAWLLLLLGAARTRVTADPAVGCDAEGSGDKRGDCPAVPSGDPYSVLGVARDADVAAVTKAYRTLARRWHPDRNPGQEDMFATVAYAYEVLTDPRKREILDRLKEAGLERLRDGDPSVEADWVAPPSPAEVAAQTAEILRQAAGANDGPEDFFEGLITASFAFLAKGLGESSFLCGVMGLGFQVRVVLGLESVDPAVYITAVDAAGRGLGPGDATGRAVVFKFTLSERSKTFAAADITHNCVSPRFTGATVRGSKTYYLECAHATALAVEVSVGANTWYDFGDRPNTASETFVLSMV
jgi:hypothetical protein